MGESNKVDVTFVIPAFNEEKNLEYCITETINTIKKLEQTYEIIIVENGSIDKTLEIAKKISSINSTVHAIHLDEPSFGGAIKKGYSMSKGNVIVNLDVDLATDMSYLKQLLEYSKKYDLVTGSRYVNKELVQRNFSRHFLSVVFNGLLVRGLLNSKIKDNNCGFRAVKRDIGIKIFENVTNNKDFGMVEFIVLAQKQNYKLKEFPVKWRENPRKVTIKTILRFLIPSLKLWYRLNFKKK